MDITLELVVNSESRRVITDARSSLLDMLRESLGLTGTHGGCEQGACGACGVLLEGELVRSCLVLARAADGRSVTTIEGLGPPDRLHPLQQAFVDHHGLQCGFCSPGMILACLDLLARNPAPTEADVREALSGNLCRCTGYMGIIDAVMSMVAGARP